MAFLMSIQKVFGLVAAVFTNDFVEMILEAAWPDLGKSMASGVRVSVHAPGTLPDMKTGISVGTGTETTLTLTPTKRVRLPPPFQSQCTTQKYVDSSKTVNYTVDSCIGICVQHQIIEQCNCVSGHFPFSDEQFRLVNYTVCGNQTAASNTSGEFNGKDLNELNGFRDLLCSYAIDIDYNACDNQCDSPCVEYIYDTSVSTSGMWPDPRYQMALYWRYVDSFPAFQEKLSAYQEISEMMKSGSFTPDEVITKLRSIDTMTRNFLQLNVLFDKMVPFLMTDKQSMTLDNLGAQLGGVLSLWLGITIMTAVEIVEFIFKIVTEYRRGKKTTVVAADVSSERNSNVIDQ